MKRLHVRPWVATSLLLGLFTLSLGCQAQRAPLTLKVVGSVGSPYLGYCVSPTPQPRLWLAELSRVRALSLSPGRLTPVAYVPRGLPQVRPTSAGQEVARRSVQAPTQELTHTSVRQLTLKQGELTQGETQGETQDGLTQAPKEREAPLTQERTRAFELDKDPSKSAQETKETKETLSCAPFKPLPHRDTLVWHIEGERLEVSAWGWRSPRGSDLRPRALRVMSVDPHHNTLYLGGEGGLFVWPLGSKRSPTHVPLPVGFEGGVTRLFLDGEGLWVRDQAGRGWAFKRAELTPLALSEGGAPQPLSAPIALPDRPPELALRVGGALLSVRRESVSARWGERPFTLPPVLDLASLSPEHVAVATSTGLELWSARGQGQDKSEGLRREGALTLGAPVTALLRHEQTLYLLSPELGLLWAEVRGSREPEPLRARAP